MNVVDSSEDDKARARQRAEEKAEAARQIAEQQMRAEEKEMASKAKEDRSAKRREFKDAGYRQSDPNLFNISEEEMRKRELQLAVRASHYPSLSHLSPRIDCPLCCIVQSLH